MRTKMTVSTITWYILPRPTVLQVCKTKRDRERAVPAGTRRAAS